jgi:hypothetical protein
LRCDSVLNSPDRVKGSVPDLNIVANNPDAASPRSFAGA